MEKLTLFCHTGPLEVYHTLYNKYMPKCLHFSYEGMTARTILVALDNNHNSERQQAVDGQGQLRYKVVFLKGWKAWVAKPVYGKKDYSYVTEMMISVIELCQSGGWKNVVLC